MSKLEDASYPAEINYDKQFELYYQRAENVEELPNKVGHVSMEVYREAVINCMRRANRNGAKTCINYVPTGFNVIMRGESKIKKSLLLSKNYKEIIEKAEGFKMKVVALGPSAKNELNLFDTVDLLNTQGMSRRGFIPHTLSIANWAELIEKDKEALIQHQIESSDDKSRVGSTIRDMDILMSKDKEVFMNLAYNDLITIVEYFSIESHNLGGIYEYL